jgi:hypothetical protein
MWEWRTVDRTALRHPKTAIPETTPLCGDNIGMGAGEQLAAEIIDAITSGRDVWVV